MSIRKQQLRAAQKTFRDTRKKEGQARLEVFITQEAFVQLTETCHKLGLSQGAYLSQELLKAPMSKEASIPNITRSVDVNNLSACSHDALIDIIRHQAYWLQRYKKIHDTLMNSVDF